MRLSFRSAGVLAPLALVVLLGAGCFGSTTPATGPGVDGGVFRTSDQGVQWKQLTSLIVAGKIGSIADVGTASIGMDPEDPAAVYVGTTQNGLLTSLDSGESWIQVKGMTSGKINAIAVDPMNKCTVLVAKANTIFKTTTCGRDWTQIFFDPKTDKLVTALAVDWFNDRNVYAGTNEGDVFRSDDGGAAWRVLERIDGIKISTIAIDPRDSRTVYVATFGAGISKTTDGGGTWTDIKEPLKTFDNAMRLTGLVPDPTTANTVYHISRYGVLRSGDAGATWTALTLPNPPGTVDIRAFAVHPRDSQQLVYATDTSIVFSNDGGKTWTPKKLPTVRGVSFIAFDRNNPANLFLGAAVKQQQ